MKSRPLLMVMPAIFATSIFITTPSHASEAIAKQFGKCEFHKKIGKKKSYLKDDARFWAQCKALTKSKIKTTVAANSFKSAITHPNAYKQFINSTPKKQAKYRKNTGRMAISAMKISVSKIVKKYKLEAR